MGAKVCSRCLSFGCQGLFRVLMVWVPRFVPGTIALGARFVPGAIDLGARFVPGAIALGARFVLGAIALGAKKDGLHYT